jgi:pancreatic triacylglycerol lipase
MAGIIGRKIKEKSNKTIKLKRISALDPAFPPFYPGLFYKPLNKKDAEMVSPRHRVSLAHLNALQSIAG